MPKLSPSALRARIERLQQQLAAAEAYKAPAIRKIRALMEKLGVTVDDLSDIKSRKRRIRGLRTAKTNAASAGDTTPPGKPRPKVAAKYRDDKGNLWTGRGKTPRWLVEAEKAGRNRESFRIT